MLRSLNELMGYRLSATDGELGSCHDFLLEDQSCVLHYMVADTRAWLPARKVLISPVALAEPDWYARKFGIQLTKAQIESCPPLESDAPISRQFEQRAFDHFGWASYWGGPFLWGPVPSPAALRVVDRRAVPAPSEEPGAGLRSARGLNGYYIKPRDGHEVGRVDDFIVSDDSWTVEYLVLGKHGFITEDRRIFSAQWIEGVHWGKRTLGVGLTAKQPEDAPTYDPRAPVNRKLLEQPYDFRGRPLPPLSSHA